MSKESQVRQGSDPKAAAAGPDLEAEHDPAASRLASNAGLQREVQKRAGGQGKENTQTAAARGVQAPRSAMPHQDRIQGAFGGHDLSGVEAHVGHESAGAMGAEAYATGNHVVFGQEPDLHTAAHEVAHVVQQREGVQLKGGVGQAGDAYEQNADAVADRVVNGQSAADLLGAPGKSAGPATQGVQKKDAKADAHAESDSQSTDGAEAALELLARQMHEYRAELVSLRSASTDGDAGNGPLLERLGAIFEKVRGSVHLADSASSNVGEQKGALRPYLGAVRGAWETLTPLMQWGLGVLDANKALKAGQFINTIDAEMKNLLGESGFELVSIASDRADPKGKTTALEDKSIKENLGAAQAALASVKAGNSGDAPRVAKHLQEIIDAAPTNVLDKAATAAYANLIKADKKQFQAIEAEMLELQKSDPSLATKFENAHFAIGHLLKIG